MIRYELFRCSFLSLLLFLTLNMFEYQRPEYNIEKSCNQKRDEHPIPHDEKYTLFCR